MGFRLDFDRGLFDRRGVDDPARINLNNPLQRYRVTAGDQVPKTGPYAFGGCFSAEQARADGFRLWVHWPDGSGSPFAIHLKHQNGFDRRSFTGRALSAPEVMQWEMQQVVHRMIMEEQAVIEEVCEKALLSGVCGVLIIRKPGERATIVGPHPDVPYGRIIEAPSEDAFDLWIERGRPL